MAVSVTWSHFYISRDLIREQFWAIRLIPSSEMNFKFDKSIPKNLVKSYIPEPNFTLHTALRFLHQWWLCTRTSSNALIVCSSGKWTWVSCWLRKSTLPGWETTIRGKSSQFTKRGYHWAWWTWRVWVSLRCWFGSRWVWLFCRWVTRNSKRRFQWCCFCYHPAKQPLPGQ